MKTKCKYKKLFMLVACTALLMSPINSSYAKGEVLTLPKTYEDKIDSQGNNIEQKEIFKELKQTNKIRFIPKTSSGKAIDSGAWIIKDDTGKIIKSFIITDKVNKFETKLKDGSYTLEQKKAPNGYIKDNNKLKFKLPITIEKEEDAFEIYPKFLSIKDKQTNQEQNENNKQNKHKNQSQLSENNEQREDNKNSKSENERNYKTGGLNIKMLLLALATIFPSVFIFVNKLLRGERNEK